MSDHTVAHGTFVIERAYPHAPEKVWAAWADPTQKAKWFGAPDGGMPAQMFDFKPGGRESRHGTIPNGPTFAFDVTYQDIVPLSRILYNYDMHMDGRKISVSLAAVEFFAEKAGTRLRLTDNELMDQLGAFLDGKR